MSHDLCACLLSACRLQDGTLDLAACKVMKEVCSDVVAAARAVTKHGKATPPVFADEWYEVHEPVVGSCDAAVMPINQAFKEALQSQLWRHHLASLSADGEEH